MPFVANFPFFSIICMMVCGIISNVLKSKKACILNIIGLSLCLCNEFCIAGLPFAESTANYIYDGSLPGAIGATKSDSALLKHSLQLYLHL